MSRNDEEILQMLLADDEDQDKKSYRDPFTLQRNEKELRHTICEVRSACQALRKHCEPTGIPKFQQAENVTHSSYDRFLGWRRWIVPWVALATVPAIVFTIAVVSRVSVPANDMSREFAAIDELIEKEFTFENEIATAEEDDLESLMSDTSQDIQFTSLLYDYEY